MSGCATWGDDAASSKITLGQCRCRKACTRLLWLVQLGRTFRRRLHGVRRVFAAPCTSLLRHDQRRRRLDGLYRNIATVNY